MLKCEVAACAAETIRRAIIDTVEKVNIDGPYLSSYQRLNGVADRLSGLVVGAPRSTELTIVQAKHHVAVHVRAQVVPVAVIEDDGMRFDEVIERGKRAVEAERQILAGVS